MYDPIATLTWVAAYTRPVRFGTAVLGALLPPPVVLGRRLATLDQVSFPQSIWPILNGGIDASCRCPKE